MGQREPVHRRALAGEEEEESQLSAAELPANCQRTAGELPANCQRNASETPAIRVHIAGNRAGLDRRCWTEKEYIMARVSNLIPTGFLPSRRRRDGKPMANWQRFVSKRPALWELSRMTNQWSASQLEY